MIDEECGILLDQYNKTGGATQYYASFIGSLAECDAQTHHDGTTRPVPRSEYKAHRIRSKSLLDTGGNAYPGKIVRFELRGIKLLKAKR